MRFAYGTIGWHGELEETFGAIADLGFEGVEMFDLLDRMEHGEEVGRMLKEAGLVLSAAYFGGSFVQEDAFARELADFEQTARHVAKLGGGFVILGGGRRRRDREVEDTRRLMQNLDKLGRAAQRAGIQLGLHPHHGTLLSSPQEIDAAMAATDPEVVKFAPDIAHLARCGGDPLDLLRRHLDRVVYVHLKDLGDVASDEFVELGLGKMPILDFFRILNERGYNGWATVELDASEDPVHSARVNAKFVREELGGTLRPRRPS